MVYWSEFVLCDPKVKGLKPDDYCIYSPISKEANTTEKSHRCH